MAIINNKKQRKEKRKEGGGWREVEKISMQGVLCFLKSKMRYSHPPQSAWGKKAPFLSKKD